MPAGPAYEQTVKTARQSLIEHRCQLQTRHAEGQPGIEICAAWARSIDAVIQSLFEDAVEACLPGVQPVAVADFSRGPRWLWPPGHGTLLGCGFAALISRHGAGRIGAVGQTAGDRPVRHRTGDGTRHPDDAGGVSAGVERTIASSLRRSRPVIWAAVFRCLPRSCRSSVAAHSAALRHHPPHPTGSQLMTWRMMATRCSCWNPT